MKDDRYRLAQTQSTISESFWQVLREYGNNDRIAVDEQVAITKSLARTLEARGGPLTRSDVLGAFERFGVRRPPNGFSRDLIARLERLAP